MEIMERLGRQWTLNLVIFTIVFININCQPPVLQPFPSEFVGSWYSIDQGNELHTTITTTQMTNENIADSECVGIQIFNDTIDAQGNYDCLMLIHNKVTNCYQCYYMYHRSTNIAQYKQTVCITQVGNRPIDMSSVCSAITPNSDILTMFRITLNLVNCKQTFEGTFSFTYEVQSGGGGICNSIASAVVACQQPGSVYVDNQVFDMYFGKCVDVTTSANQQIRFQCMGTWVDPTGNIFSGMADLGQDQYRQRFRCMLTRNDQQYADNTRYYVLSRWAECSTLITPYDGPIRLRLWPAYIGSLGVSVYGQTQVSPNCIFPRNFTGSWFTTAEFDSNVIINMTHIYFKTKLDMYTYRESYFACQENRDSRYLVTAVTVGRCEVDYICFDFMPRHQSIIRWRMGKPYRLSPAEMSVPNYMESKFRQACTWSAFTLNRDETDWKYYTFILNPPSPVPCPVGGRYNFTQVASSPDELYVTRVRGITERPRHNLDCHQYVSEFKSCDDNPKELLVDAEYCATLDHTGKPIGEYEMADHILTCAGYWLEDMKSYMITYDLEDVVSGFRCWVYERRDWRDIYMSRAIRANCDPLQTAYSSTAAEGASLALVLKESERLWDSCPQRYDTGANPYAQEMQIFVLDSALSLKTSAMMSLLPLTLSLIWF